MKESIITCSMLRKRKADDQVILNSDHQYQENLFSAGGESIM
jgi:hypothetical protein